MKTVRRERYVS